MDTEKQPDPGTVEGGSELAERVAKAIEAAPQRAKGAHEHEFEDRFDLDAIRKAWAEHGDEL